jgi:hypothetical protein
MRAVRFTRKARLGQRDLGDWMKTLPQPWTVAMEDKTCRMKDSKSYLKSSFQNRRDPAEDLFGGVLRSAALTALFALLPVLRAFTSALRWALLRLVRNVAADRIVGPVFVRIVDRFVHLNRFLRAVFCPEPWTIAHGLGRIAHVCLPTRRSRKWWRAKQNMQGNHCRVRYAGRPGAHSVRPKNRRIYVPKRRELTQLPGIGSYLNHLILEWLNERPEPLEPAGIRRDFLSLATARSIRKEHKEVFETVQGDLQMHKRWSDGSAPIQEMAEAAALRRYSYIAITDHAKGLKIAGGIDENQLARQADEIAEVNRSRRHR